MTILEKAKEYQEKYVSSLTDKGGASDIILAFVRGAMEATRWIPIDESIPGKDGRYLVKHNRRIMLLCFNAHYKCWDDADGDDCYCDINQVSHWRPIEFE